MYDNTILNHARRLSTKASFRYGDVVMVTTLLFPARRMFYSATSMEMIRLRCLTQEHECIL